MILIELNTIEDFNQAIALIGDYKDSLPNEVTYIGEGRNEPDLTKPYTTCDENNLTIDADEMVRTILDDNNIEYVIKDYRI